MKRDKDFDSEEQTEKTENNVEYIVDPNTSEVFTTSEQDSEEEKILLTFDDAPDHYALQIAELLNDEDIPAIFFVNGHFLIGEEAENMLREIHEVGFEIGNHTYNYPVLPELSTKQQRNEIIRLSDGVEEIIRERPCFFRAPYGENKNYAT